LNKKVFRRLSEKNANKTDQTNQPTMFALSLLLALASAAIVTAQAPTPPQPVFPPPCATLTQVTVSSFGTPNNTSVTTDAVVTVDTQNGFQLMRVDTLNPPLPNGEQSLTTFLQLGPKQEAVISNYLNGTVTCFTTSGGVSPTPLPGFTFVGVETNSGVQANHWRSVQSTGGSYQTDLWTEAADNDVLLYATVSAGSVTQLRATFAHYIKCAAGSVDPSLFAIPSGLSCPALPQGAVPNVNMNAVAATMAMFN
jgi:hypothetical protein